MWLSDRRLSNNSNEVVRHSKSTPNSVHAKKGNTVKRAEYCGKTTMMIIVIGRGHSGTRSIAQTLYASNVYMGSLLNNSCDFVPPHSLYRSCHIFAKYVKYSGNYKWDFSEVFAGENGLNYYPNSGVGYWGVMMDDVSYDSRDIQGSVGGKVAIIDSGNTSIQLPNSEFE